MIKLDGKTYGKGAVVPRGEAFARLVRGERLIYRECVIEDRGLTGAYSGGFWSHNGSEWIKSGLSFDSEFYEMKPVPEYNMTFAEAMTHVFNGGRVILQGDTVPLVLAVDRDVVFESGHPLMISRAVLQGKYAVVK